VQLANKLKKKKTDQKNKKTGSIIAVIIITAAISGGVYYYNQQKISEADLQWKNTSGPFAINKFQYKIGEYIFVIVSDLKPNEAGKIVFVDPKGDNYYTIPFNGTLKTSFKQLFKPNTENIGGVKLCNPTDLVGKWNVFFNGVPYKTLKFEIVNDWIPGAEAEIKPIPADLCKE